MFLYMKKRAWCITIPNFTTPLQTVHYLPFQIHNYRIRVVATLFHSRHKYYINTASISPNTSRENSVLSGDAATNPTAPTQVKEKTICGLHQRRELKLVLTPYLTTEVRLSRFGQNHNTECLVRLCYRKLTLRYLYVQYNLACGPPASLRYMEQRSSWLIRVVTSRIQSALEYST